MSKIGSRFIGRDGEDTNAAAVMQTNVSTHQRNKEVMKVKIHKHSILPAYAPFGNSAAIRYKLQSKRKGVLCEAAPKGARQEDILFCEDILSSVSRSLRRHQGIATMPALARSIVLPCASALDTIEDEMDLTRFEPYFTDEITDTYDVKIHMLLHFHERLSTYH